MFSVADQRVDCLATTIYLAGHFSTQHMADSEFDFPLSVTSVYNICMKFYHNIKKNVFKCTWSDGKWRLRILWVGIGLAEESILLVLYFRQLGVFMYIVGLELDDQVIARAQASVSKYNLDAHFKLETMNVLLCDVNFVRRNKIQIVYTSAVVDNIFVWKLYLFCVASPMVQAFIAPTGELSNLHHIQNKEGRAVGQAQFDFYPAKSCDKRTLVIFCGECEVAVGPRHNSIDDHDLQKRSFHMVVMTEEMHSQKYVDEICTQGRWHLIEIALKNLTMSGAQNFKDWLTRTFESGKLEGRYATGYKFKIQHLTLVNPISHDMWVRWKKHYTTDCTLKFAMTELRIKCKKLLRERDLFCDIFPSNIIVSDTPVVTVIANEYTHDDCEYLLSAFENEDHPGCYVTMEEANEEKGQGEEAGEKEGEEKVIEHVRKKMRIHITR
jgi:hypothetical protein